MAWLLPFHSQRVHMGAEYLSRSARLKGTYGISPSGRLVGGAVSNGILPAVAGDCQCLIGRFPAYRNRDIPRRSARPGRLAAMSLLDDLRAFAMEHERCGELEGDVKTDRIWMT